MLLAKKQNKQYKITLEQKDRYLKEGFAIYDKNGKFLESQSVSDKDTIKKLKAENEKLKQENKKLKANKG